MLIRLSTIAVLLFLAGCAKFDEAREYVRCQKAYPNNDIATDKCLEFAASEWAGKTAWLPRVVERRAAIP